MILTRARAKDRELTQYQINNFNVDKDIEKAFHLNKKTKAASGYDSLI